MSLGNLNTTGQKNKNYPFQAGAVAVLYKILNSLGAGVTVTPTFPLNSVLADDIVEGADNASLKIAVAAWRAANPTFKVVSQVNINSISAQAVLITYTT